MYTGDTDHTPPPCSPRYDPSGKCSNSLLTQGLASFAPTPSLPDDTGNTATGGDGSAVGSGDTTAGGGVGAGFFFLGLVLAALAGAGMTFFLLPRCMRKKGSAATIITDRKLDIGL